MRGPMAKNNGIEEADFGAQSVIVTGGMSLRDYFAAAALTGLAGNLNTRDACPRCGALQYGAKQAYAIADAMIEARTENGGE